MIQLAFMLAAAIATPDADTSANKADSHIVVLSDSLPDDHAKQTSPDRVEPFYEAINGTHFTYNCATAYTFKSKEAAVDVCEIEPVTLRIDNWPETEVIYLLEGSVTVTESDSGTVKSFKAGDKFVLPQGFRGIWTQKSRIKKMTVRHPLYWKD